MSFDKLIVTASPHIKAGDTTPRIMWHVVASLVPVIMSSAWFFGISALLVIAAATLGALITERLIGRPGALHDGSATITGLLLGLSLPSGFPMWMAFLGGAFGIGDLAPACDLRIGVDHRGHRIELAFIRGLRTFGNDQTQ